MFHHKPKKDAKTTTQNFLDNTWVGECALHDLSSYLVANIEGAGNMQEKTFSELLRDLLQFKSQPGGTLIAQMTIDEISNLESPDNLFDLLIENRLRPSNRSMQPTETC